MELGAKQHPEQVVSILIDRRRQRPPLGSIGASGESPAERRPRGHHPRLLLLLLVTQLERRRSSERRSPAGQLRGKMARPQHSNKSGVAATAAAAGGSGGGTVWASLPGVLRAHLSGGRTEHGAQSDGLDHCQPRRARSHRPEASAREGASHHH